MADNPYEDLIKNPRAEPAPSGVPQVTVRPPGGNPYDDLVTARRRRPRRSRRRAHPASRSASYGRPSIRRASGSATRCRTR